MLKRTAHRQSQTIRSQAQLFRSSPRGKTLNKINHLPARVLVPAGFSPVS
jgi:hypothetical protein